MSRPSWASIVKPNNSSASSPYEADELNPMDVNVPEPPPPNKLEGHLETIKQRKSKIQEEIEQKDTKFKSSYAFTRYNEEMIKLAEEERILNEKESDIKRAIILRDGTYTKTAMEAVNRIYRYIGPDYLLQYTGYMGIRAMFYKIELGPAYMFFSNNGEGLRVNIEDSFSIDCEWPNKIYIVFKVENADMIPILESAIHTVLTGFELRRC